MRGAKKVSLRKNLQRRKQGRRGIRRARRGGRRVYIERITFSLKVGSTTNITISNLKSKPTNCNYRPLAVIAHCATVVPTIASDARAGYYSPAAIQVDFYGPEGKMCASSAPQVIYPQGRRVRCRYPRSADWWDVATAGSTILAKVTAICLGNNKIGDEADQYVQGIFNIPVAFGPEIMAGTCPKYQHISSEDTDIVEEDNDLQCCTPQSFDLCEMRQ